MHRLIVPALTLVASPACLAATRPLPPLPPLGAEDTRIAIVDVRATQDPLDVAFADAIDSAVVHRCRTPCRLQLAVGRYRLTPSRPGAGRLDSQFVVIEGEHLQVVVAPPQSFAPAIPPTFIPIGATAMGVGAGLLGYGASLAAPRCSSFLGWYSCSPGDPATGTPFIAAGVLTLLAGTGLFVAGVAVNRGNRSHVVVRHVGGWD